MYRELHLRLRLGDGRILSLRGDVPQGEPDKLGRRLVAGKMPFIPDRFPYAAVQALNGVRRVDDFPDRLGEREERYNVLPAPWALSRTPVAASGG